MGYKGIIETNPSGQKSRIVVSAIIFAGFVLFAGIAFGSVEIGSDRPNIDLNPDLEILVDKNNTLTILDIAFGKAANQFQSSKKTGLNFGFTRAAVWVRFSLHNDSDKPENRVLVIDNPPMQRADLYIPLGERKFRIIPGGTAVPFSEKILKQRVHAYPIELKLNKSKTYYVRLQSETTMMVNLKLRTPEFNAYRERWEVNLLIFTVGIFLSLVFYYLVTYASTRENLYLYLTSLTVSLGMFVFTSYGLAPILLWPENVILARLALPFFGSLALFWGLISIKAYISKKLHLPIVDYILGWTMFFAGTLIILTFFHSYITNILNTLVCLVLFIIMAYVSYKSLRSGLKFEKPVWAAVTLCLLGMALFLLMTLGLLTFNLWTYLIGPLCFFVAGIFIIMSLGLRVTTLRRKYSHVFETINEGIIIYSTETEIITAINKKALEIFKSTAEQAEELDLPALCKRGNTDLPDIVNNFLKKSFSEEPKVVEIAYKSRTGAPFWGETSLIRTEINGQNSLLIVIREITEHKKAAEKLVRNEEEIRRIMDAQPNMIAFVDSEQKYQFVNQAYEHRFNLKKEEIVGQYIWEIMGDEAYGNIKKYVEKVLVGKNVYYELPINYKTGDSRIVAVSYFPQFDSDNLVNGFVALISDITDTKRNETSLKITQHMIDHAGDAAGWIADGKIAYVNRKACELLGYSRNQLLTMEIYDVFPELAIDNKGYKIWKIVKKQGEFSFEISIKTDTDSPVHVEISATHMIYDEVEYTLFFIRDITKRKQAQNALIHHEKRLDLALSAAQLAIWDWTITPGELFFSEGWAKILGYEMIKVPLDLERVLDAVHCKDKPRIRSLINRFASGELKDGTDESRIQTKTGDYVWVQVNAKVVDWDDKGSPLRVIGIGKDITESKQVEQALLDYQAQLKSLTSQLMQAEHLERKRIATYLHDGVCQYLSSANMQLSFFRDQETSEQKADKIDRILNSIKSAYRVSRNLTFDLHPPVLNELGLEAAIDELVKDFEGQTGLKCIFEHSGPDLDLKRNLRGYIYRMIQELLTNIRKHAQAECCKINLVRKPNQMRINIEDDGRGFSMEETVVRKSKNRGFGLFSIQEQLLQLGGWIEIGARPGKGSLIKLYIPVYSDDITYKEIK